MKSVLARASELSVELPAAAYDRYSQTRPHHPAPRSIRDLVEGKEPAFRKRFAPFLPQSKDARILDLGCGYGEFLSFLQREGYAAASGIDLDPAQIELARDLGVRNVCCGDAVDFLQSAGKYDLISAVDVVEHFAKHEVIGLLERIRGALSPGGRFLCQVPNLAAFYAPLFFMDFTHQTPFTAASLKQALEIAGFVNVRVFPMGPVAHGLRSTVRCVLWRAVTGVFQAIQTIEGGPRDGLGSIFTAAVCAIAEKGHEATL